jgi:hypothetical protein
MTSVTNAPRLTAATAEQLAADLFEVRGQASPLPSERDQNFRIDAADGRAFVLKIANPGEDRAMLEAENAAMGHLASIGLVPAVVPRGQAAHRRTSMPRQAHHHPGRPPRTFLATRMRCSTSVERSAHRPCTRVVRSPAVHAFSTGSRERACAYRSTPAARRGRAVRSVVESILRLTRTRLLRGCRRFAAPFGDVNDFNVLADAGSNRVMASSISTGVQHTNDAAIAMACASLDKSILGAAAMSGGLTRRIRSRNRRSPLFGLMRAAGFGVCVAAEQQPASPTALPWHQPGGHRANAFARGISSGRALPNPRSMRLSPVPHPTRG